jgi:hypothetical protein
MEENHLITMALKTGDRVDKVTSIIVIVKIKPIRDDKDHSSGGDPAGETQ